MHLKISSVKWRPFCAGGDELKKTAIHCMPSLSLKSGNVHPAFGPFLVIHLCLDTDKKSGKYNKHYVPWLLKFLSIHITGALQNIKRMRIQGFLLMRFSLVKLRWKDIGLMMTAWHGDTFLNIFALCWWNLSISSTLLSKNRQEWGVLMFLCT